ncbi:hypothetical protein [Vibrio crassostreae]|uniref:hypothetical protein n=1 Tax=Vibrio crassostreae TaxID=246167 RepID=UPI001B31583F|nr:hypothetical protein [Vibrio crassostreae]
MSTEHQLDSISVYGALGKICALINKDKASFLNESAEGMSKFGKNSNYVLRQCILRDADFSEETIGFTRRAITKGQGAPVVKIAQIKGQQVGFIYDGLTTYLAVRELLKLAETESQKESLKKISIDVETVEFKSEADLHHHMNRNIEQIEDHKVYKSNPSVRNIIKQKALGGQGESNKLRDRSAGVLKTLSKTELEAFKIELAKIATGVVGREINSTEVSISQRNMSKDDMFLGLLDMDELMLISVCGAEMFDIFEGLDAWLFYEFVMKNYDSPYYQPLSTRQIQFFDRSINHFKEQFKSLNNAS